MRRRPFAGSLFSTTCSFLFENYLSPFPLPATREVKRSHGNLPNQTKATRPPFVSSSPPLLSSLTRSSKDLDPPLHHDRSTQTSLLDRLRLVSEILVGESGLKCVGSGGRRSGAEKKERTNDRTREGVSMETKVKEAERTKLEDVFCCVVGDKGGKGKSASRDETKRDSRVDESSNVSDRVGEVDSGNESGEKAKM